MLIETMNNSPVNTKPIFNKQIPNGNRVLVSGYELKMYAITVATLDSATGITTTNAFNKFNYKLLQPFLY